MSRWKKTLIWLAVLVFGVILTGAAITSWLGQSIRQQQAGFTDVEGPPSAERVRYTAALTDLDAVLGEAILERYGESRDQRLTDRVVRMGADLASEARSSDGMSFRFTVLADAKTARTIALPRGSIYLTEKLVRQIKDADQLAAVLAHEMGHAQAQHPFYGMRSGATMLAWIETSANGKADPRSAETRQLLDAVLDSRYSDADEHQADTIAARMLTDTRRDPATLLAVPKLMQNAKLDEMVLVHPDSPARAAVLEERARENDRARRARIAREAESLISGKFGGVREPMTALQLGGQLTVFTVGMEKMDDVDFNFHALTAPGVNAYVIPSGDIFATEDLLKLLKSDAEVSAFWSHMVGHMVARHRAREMAGIMQDPDKIRDDQRSARLVDLVLGTKYTPQEETEAVAAGARTMLYRQFDPRLTTAVMEKVAKASSASSQPAFAAIHPLPANSTELIRAEIDKMFPKGLPDHFR